MAVHVVSIENAHALGDLIPSMHRLRYKESKERQSYDIPVFKDMEYDAYDTLATVYIVWQDEQGVVRGCSRMAPTDRAYMIKDLWPSMVTAIALPQQADIWESSRFCIDSGCPSPLRQRIKLEILQAKIEYALAVNVKGMVGVMPPLIWRAVFVNSGWPVDHIGPVTELNTGEKVVAGWMHVHSAILVRLRAKTSFPHSLLESDKTILPLLRRVA
jgi:N-acyl-L-homoserine lactone synthetase